MQTLTNSAQIDYQYSASGKIMNIGTKTNYVTTNISKFSINLLKTANSNYYAPGERIGYNIFISNNSSAAVYNVKIVDILPIFLNFIENSAIITNKNGNISQISKKNINIKKDIMSKVNKNLNYFEFYLGNLEPNETAILSYFVSILPSQKNLPECIETYSILYFYDKNKKTDKEITVKSNINSINKAYALLEAEKIVDKTTAYCGDSLIYTISLKNKGNIDATNVRITDILPEKFKLTDINFIIADLPYSSTYKIDENNILNIPSSSKEIGLCIPANTSDNSIIIKGIVLE